MRSEQELEWRGLVPLIRYQVSAGVALLDPSGGGRSRAPIQMRARVPGYDAGRPGPWGRCCWLFSGPSGVELLDRGAATDGGRLGGRRRRRSHLDFPILGLI
jgi:hypothetical protein